MKKIFILLFFLTATFFAGAQNVGIGTTTPIQKLHVEGTTLLNGNVGIGYSTPLVPLSFNGNLGDKISLWTDGTATHYGFGIQSGLLQIFSKTSLDDIAFGYGSSNSFTETMRMKGNGIMQFPASLAKKINLYSGSTGDAGFGVFGNEFRIASDYSGADITFGYDHYTNGFTERMRIKGNGNVGIGTNNPLDPLHVNGVSLFTPGGSNIQILDGNRIQAYINGGLNLTTFSDDPIKFTTYTSGGGSGGERMRILSNGNIGLGVTDPALKLDISGRMRIRTGTDGEAGIWLNNLANTALQAFIGLENNNYVGFYGAAGAGWKFAMNTQTGALKINGTEGTSGQVLQSNGNGAPGIWTNAGNIIKTFYLIQGGLGMDVTSSSWVEIPGITFNINLTVKSRLIISATFTSAGIFCPGGGCNGGCAQITIEIDGNLITLPFDDGITRIVAAPNSDGSTNISNYFYDVNTGSHTIKFKVKLGCDLSSNLIDNLRCSMATIVALPVD